MNQLSALAFLGIFSTLPACQAEPPVNPNDRVQGGFGADAGASTSGSAGLSAAGSSIGPGGAGSHAGSTGVAGGASGGAAQAGHSGAAGVAGAAAGSSGGGAVAQAGQGGVAGSGGAAGTGGVVELPPIEECTGTPSVDRFTQWVASGEGTTVPATGSILVKQGDEYVGKVQLVGAGWHVVPVYIKNKFGESLDLSTSAGITLTYSATAELHVQLRTKSHWSGGNQYATTIPSTGGKTETRFFSFAEAGWKSLFGAPVLSYADSLKEGMGLVFVGEGANEVVFYGMRIDGYTPPCP